MKRIIVSKRKRLVPLFLIAVLVVMMLPAPSPSTSPVAAQDEPLRIALMIGSGSNLEDGGFNESSWLALQDVVEVHDAEIADFRPIDPDDAVGDLTELVEDDYDVIVTVGFNLAEATTIVAQEYPEQVFVGVDQFQGEALDNLVGLIFPEDKSGFLAGILAASLTETGIVGGVFGTAEVPPVVAFREGYESGVRWASAEFERDIEVLAEYHPGTALDAFSDPNWGASIAAQQLAEGADVIFAAGGETGNGALVEVAFTVEDTDDTLYCIGVDSDQWLTVEDAHSCLVSSATKEVRSGVFTLVEQYINGTLQGGNFLGDVGLADFHEFDDMIDDDTRDLLDRVAFGLRTNSILTCYNADMSGLKIGMVMDIDQPIDDGSFNESVWNGLRAAEFCGAQIDFVETSDTLDYSTNITEFADDEYNIIVTVGFALAEATNAAAEAYPDIRFVGVDQFQEEVTTGVTGMIFQEANAGFLAGVLAANLTESSVVAGVYGTDIIPPVVAFKDGFEAGVRYVDEDINVISTFHPGGVDTAFSDPQWGATTARQALDQGADVVFAAGGLTGNGSLIEVASIGTNPPYCIGVDTDQWLTLPEAHPCLVSSAMKLLDAAMADMVLQHLNGTLQDGNYVGLVGLAPFHDFETVIPEDLQAELAAIAEQLSSGSLDPADY